MKKRCAWVTSDPDYIAYHDQEWGVPVHDDQRLFEFLILEGAQAGLSWLTILKKRAHYRQALDHFDPVKIARYGPDQIDRLLQNPRIVRNRKKIGATVANARAFLDLKDKFGRFNDYLWRFVDYAPRQNHWPNAAAVPAQTALSRALSKDLKHHGFQFVGPVICYAFMQAVGMVNDHTVDCFRYPILADPASTMPGNPAAT